MRMDRLRCRKLEPLERGTNPGSSRVLVGTFTQSSMALQIAAAWLIVASCSQIDLLYPPLGVEVTATADQTVSYDGRATSVHKPL
jgi:hypothetical protein